MKPTLLVLAAGIGSRYGGLKQIDPVGPSGEIIIDYSIYDALRANFGKVVFVIRQEIEPDFREHIGDKYADRLRVEYVYQTLTAETGAWVVPANRKKPWGTAHATLLARQAVGEPFAVINADDFYGAEAFSALARFLNSAEDKEPAEYAMVGFTLRNTLSPFGSVARGVCKISAQNHLETIREITKIEKAGNRAGYVDENNDEQYLSGNEIVSMNTWAFTPSIFKRLESGFREFLREKGNTEKSEFFLPAVIDNLISGGKATVNVLPTNSKWFGITYPDDKPLVEKSIRDLVQQGTYPENLWG